MILLYVLLIGNKTQRTRCTWLHSITLYSSSDIINSMILILQLRQYHIIVSKSSPVTEALNIESDISCQLSVHYHSVANRVAVGTGPSEP